eukprot:GHRR01005126.1.p1 GENE.GHRR01005126.1~~GHRR01005126.1.p1  ORF type:complete len:150 (+),score=26.97 GHRR01005126.1:141-590(+)
MSAIPIHQCLGATMQQTFFLRGVSHRSWVPATSSGPRRGLRVALNASHVDDIKKTVADNKVVVYSKTYCPYCAEAKGLFQQLSVPAKVIELDQVNGGADIQLSLQEITGRRTVPQVFVGGKHVGGCDDTMAAYSSGELKKLLAGVGFQT